MCYWWSQDASCFTAVYSNEPTGFYMTVLYAEYWTRIGLMASQIIDYCWLRTIQPNNKTDACFKFMLYKAWSHDGAYFYHLHAHLVYSKLSLPVSKIRAKLSKS